MYFKLALQNVKKSYKDFLIYFLTLAFSVCLFYTFNSFQAQQAVIEMNETQSELIESMGLLMKILSIFVAFVLGFLILYANNFLIRRRKKELGLYTLLGMPKGKISSILVYETFLIGLISLITGMIFGILLSQLLTAVTANLFEVTLDYHFVFSVEATIFTIISFAVIFFIVMIFNSLILNRYKLIDLLNADKKNESLKIKNITLSIVTFLMSLAFLGGAYYYSWNDPIHAFMVGLIPVIIAGCIGTFLFFMSLSGFLLTFIQKSKKLYFKKLNVFVLRQINANINSNFVSMSVVCIMLLLSIGALATGLNMNNTLNNSIKNSTPYDFSCSTRTPREMNQIGKDMNEMISKMEIDTAQIKEQFTINAYSDGTTMEALIPYIDSFSNDTISAASLSQQPMEIIPLSKYNEILEKMGEEPIVLKDTEVFMTTTLEAISPMIHDILDAKPQITVFGNKASISNDEYYPYNIGTTAMVGTIMAGIIVPDDMIPSDASILYSYWNADLNDPSMTQQFLDEFMGKLDQLKQTNSAYDAIYYDIETAEAVIDSSKGMSVIFTYIGIYLGIVFMIASAVILALQQLSQANENRRRYSILSKIGASSSMIHSSILKQLCIYFFMPLMLAIIHSIVGIRVVNTIVMMFGSDDIFTSSLYTAGIILLIYGSYFFVTYVSYKSIIRSK